jgi:HEAT repeat protein
MASSLAQSLLAAVVAAVVAGTTVAQDPNFLEGVKLYRLGGKENLDKALEKFQDVLKKDPSNEEALKLYQSISQDEWFMLLGDKGEIQKIAASILERAKLEQKKSSRDEAKIKELVGKVAAKDTTYEERHAAVLQLVAQYGEFAVPALAACLGNADDENGQVQAIAALAQISTRATLPLMELTKSSQALMRLNAAAALTHINDDRAAPAMARLLQSDDNEGVREVARRFLQKHHITSKASELYLAQAREYLRGGVRPGAYSEVVWTLKNDKLEAKDVPQMIYPAELSKAAANDAMLADPTSGSARTMLAEANLAEANLIETSLASGDAGAKALEPMVADFKMAALATGPAVLRNALDDGVRSGLPAVAVGAIEALAAVEERDQLGSSSLLEALNSGDKRVKYAAAIALARASGGVNTPAADKVVDALAQAVTEEAVKTIQLIGPGVDFQAAAKEVSAQRGSVIAVEASGKGGMRHLLDAPADVVVINEILSDDRLPEDLIGTMKRDTRMANTKVVIVGKDVEKAKARFGETVQGVIAAPLTGANLLEAVNKALEGVAVEPQNARAENYAKGASEALLTLASGKSAIGGALGSLAAQLNRGDSVSVPAAKALGLSGNQAQLQALLAALAGGGSVDLKVAVANAIGQILGRADACPAPISEGLMGVLNSDADVKIRVAAAAALGKAKLDDASKAKLLDSMKKIGSVPAAQG